MVIIIVWITILMCAIGAIALYIVKGNSIKSKKVETIKNKFSITIDLNTINSFKYRVWFNNTLISSHKTKEEAIEHINEIKKDYEGMKPMVLFMKNTLVRYWWNVKSWWLVIPDLGKMIIVFILICAIQLLIMYNIFGIPDWFE